MKRWLQRNLMDSRVLRQKCRIIIRHESSAAGTYFFIGKLAIPFHPHLMAAFHHLVCIHSVNDFNLGMFVGRNYFF